MIYSGMMGSLIDSWYFITPIQGLLEIFIAFLYGRWAIPIGSGYRPVEALHILLNCFRKLFLSRFL